MGTIRIRAKQGEVPGDAVSFNDYGVDNGFPRSVYPGQEFDIPDDLLDDKEDFKLYRYEDKTAKMLTEKQYRIEVEKRRGYSNHAHYAEAAPLPSVNKSILMPPRLMSGAEHVQFLKKQRDAVLKYRHFNPCWMELISEESGSPMTNEDERKSPGTKTTDITTMKVKEAIEYIKSIKDEGALSDLSIVLDRSPNPNPVLIQHIELQLKTLRGQ